MSNTQSALTLDYHTRQFFDPIYCTGAVEARFQLSVPGLEGREFVGRMARLCTGTMFQVLQDVGKEACFVRRFPVPASAGPLRPQDVQRWWRELLQVDEPAPATGNALPVLPELAGNFGLARLHFDKVSGFGLMVASSDECALFDLRDEQSAEKRHHPLVDLEGALCPNGMAALCDMAQEEFHAGVDALLRDEAGLLFQTLRFYRQSDDGRAGSLWQRLPDAGTHARCVAVGIASGLGTGQGTFGKRTRGMASLARGRGNQGFLPPERILVGGKPGAGGNGEAFGAGVCGNGMRVAAQAGRTRLE